MAVTFPYWPNWAEKVKMSREYKTEINTSRTFMESRKRLRQQPWRRMEFSVLASPERYAEIRDFMWHYIEADFWIPDFTRPWFLAAPVEALGDTITITEPIPTWLKADAKVVLKTRTQEWHVDVLSVDSGTGEIVLAEASALDWPTGAKLYGKMYGRVEQTVPFEQRALETREIDFTFIEDPNSGYPEIEVDAPEMFNGAEVWLRKPNWRQPVPHDITGYLKTQEYGQGAFAHQYRWNQNSFTEEHTLSFRSRQEAEEVIGFFNRQAGRGGEFWLPTWREDMTPVNDLQTNVKELLAFGLEPWLYHYNDRIFQRFMVLLKTGERIYNIARFIGQEGSNSKITVVNPWPRDIARSEIDRVCWMPLVRFASDRLAMEWITDDIAETRITFQSTAIPPATEAELAGMSPPPGPPGPGGGAGGGGGGSGGGGGGGSANMPPPPPFVPPPGPGPHKLPTDQPGQISADWYVKCVSPGYPDSNIEDVGIRLTATVYREENGEMVQVGYAELYHPDRDNEADLDGLVDYFPGGGTHVEFTYRIIQAFPLFSYIETDERGPVLINFGS